MRVRALVCVLMAGFCGAPEARATMLGRVSRGADVTPQAGEVLIHEAHMLVRVGARLIGSSDLAVAPALAHVSSFARQTTGPQAALDALVFMTLWHDEVDPSQAVHARLRAEAQTRWQDQLAALDATAAARLSVDATQVLEYMVLTHAFRDYIQRRFSIEQWPPTSAESERRLGLEDKMRIRVMALGQRMGVEVLDPVALQRLVPGWSWPAAVERFLALGL